MAAGEGVVIGVKLTHERLAVESSFRFRLIGPEVLDVVFLSKLVFALVLGASALSALFLDSERLSFVAGVLALSDGVRSSKEKFEFIFQGTVEKKKVMNNTGQVLLVSCVRFFLFVRTKFAVSDLHVLRLGLMRCTRKKSKRTVTTCPSHVSPTGEIYCGTNLWDRPSAILHLCNPHPGGR